MLSEQQFHCNIPLSRKVKLFFNILMPGGNKKGPTYFNKPAAKAEDLTYLLPPGIKGLIITQTCTSK